MITIYETLKQAKSARDLLPNKVGGFAYTNHIRKTLDGKFAVIAIPKDCWLSEDTLCRYNLPSSTFGLFDMGEPDEEVQ